MKRIFVLPVVIVMMAVSSCGNNKTETKTETPKSTELAEPIKPSTEASPTPTPQPPSSTEAATSTKNWDEILNTYEGYIDQYIVLLKKSKKGDASAMGEYGEMLEKAQKLQTELDGAKAELNGKQMNRLMKISQKMMEAATTN